MINLYLKYYLDGISNQQYILKLFATLMVKTLSYNQIFFIIILLKKYN